jgi:hypothetical protein
MPCPLCLLGFPQEHTKEDWEMLGSSDELKDKLIAILKEKGWA